jgi:hypothetical protein
LRWKPNVLTPFTVRTRGLNVSSPPETSRSPSAGTPVGVRIDTLEVLTDDRSSWLLKVNRRRWFSAISVMAQPVCVQPRSQL